MSALKALMVEIKVVIALFLTIPLVWTLLVLIEVLAAGAVARSFLLPVGGLVLGGLVVAGVLLRMASSRIAGFVIAGLFALIHALGLLGAQLWWVRVFSGLAFAGYIYAAVLLNSMPLRRFVLGDRA